MKNHKIIPMCLLTIFSGVLSAEAADQSKSFTSKSISSKKVSKHIIHNNVHDTAINHTDHNCGTDDNGQNWKQLQREFSEHVKAEKHKNSGFRLSANESSLLTPAADGSIAVDGRYYIPVVFHVYGDEYNCSDATAKCLTDEKIAQALKFVNEDFQGLNTEDGPIASQFQAIRKNHNVEFVLAKKTPNGSPSTGIVRHQREQAGFGQNSNESAEIQDLISADSWDNFKYMNVYLMHDLYADGGTNSSGIAWYPELSMSNAGTARVVYNGHFTGANTNHNQRSILTHEFGHWLNLIHTFEGKTCSVTNQAFCKITGDRSCDTPQMSLPEPMQNNAKNCLGEATNTENFMHYSDNYAMFTQEQVERMTAALHHPARSTLWSNDNLIATGLSEYTSNSDHPWDGVTGVDGEAEGTVLETFTDIAANQGEVDTFEINLPEGATNVLFYLNGYTQDPDLYVSSGVAPTAPLDENGNVDNNGTWVKDYFSFNGRGEAESVTIGNPNTALPYFASVHAFSGYDNATLKVIQVEDPFLSEGMKRYTLFEQNALWAISAGKVYDFQFKVPADAKKVVIVVPGKYEGPKQASGKPVYSGDLDVYINQNKPVVLGAEEEDYDCRPFSAKAIAEYCEFSEGGTFNVLVNPFASYTQGTIKVYYETSNTGNQLPFAHTNGVKHYEAVGHGIAFSSNNSNDPDGSIVSYFWNFGDGNTSTSKNPVHTYNAVGEYDVSLTVTDNLGAEGTSNAKAFITLNSPNDVDLCDDCTRFYLNDEINLSAIKGDELKTYQFEVPDAASLVTFELVSHYNGDPDIYISQNKAVSLEEADCSPFASPDQTELCQFTSGGIYNVIIDPFLDYDSLRFRAYYDIRDDADHSAPNRLPVSIPGDNYTGRVNNTITLNGLQSTDEDGSIVQYLWDFGSGITKTGVTASHIYQHAGAYTVILTVTDNQGATHSSTTQVNILPIGDFDGDGDIDSDDIQSLVSAINNNEPLNSTFDINGDGVINFDDTVALRELCSYEQCSNIKPPPQPPVAVSSANKTTVFINTQIQFDSSNSTDKYGRIVSYAWDFGDGNSSDFANPRHQYTQPGVYDVVLTVTDNDDMAATSTLTVSVNHQPLVDECSITAADNSGDLAPSVAKCVGTKKGFTFNNMNRDGHKTVAISMINAPEDSLIYFGDGNWPKINLGEYTAVSTAQDDQQCIFYTIPENANYWGYITLTGAPAGATIVFDYDVASCRPTTQELPNQAPTAVANVENGETNTFIQFSSAGSNDVDGEIVSYTWDFGDNTNSTLANPVHQYSTVGTYNVTLTVTDNEGLASSIATDVIISPIVDDGTSLNPLHDACAIDGATTTPRTLTPGKAGCIGTKRIFAFSELKRNHTTVAITLINAPTDSSIYFKDGGWPKIATGNYSVVSSAQDQQQCAFYTIPTNANDWGYIELSGNPEGATIVVDYDVASCRPLAQ
ncbi:hypothetical protein B0W48_13745 [Pseudoalteromonas aliena]|uniref:PKD domain-containing protein n=1 Tax=Pseudoalteromonas aliena TaxID=247523 RepID=A0A1Q2H090_9GAMM|nr:PKD domain-containing protein [Pseudoalteromonas aliena]AQQ00777.1 hypothetical protein B0W48_13745 [Pseudoalteromonas aliena]